MTFLFSLSLPISDENEDKNKKEMIITFVCLFQECFFFWSSSLFICFKISFFSILFHLLLLLITFPMNPHIQCSSFFWFFGWPAFDEIQNHFFLGKMINDEAWIFFCWWNFYCSRENEWMNFFNAEAVVDHLSSMLIIEISPPPTIFFWQNHHHYLWSIWKRKKIWWKKASKISVNSFSIQNQFQIFFSVWMMKWHHEAKRKWKKNKSPYLLCRFFKGKRKKNFLFKELYV